VAVCLGFTCDACRTFESLPHRVLCRSMEVIICITRAHCAPITDPVAQHSYLYGVWSIAGMHLPVSSLVLLIELPIPFSNDTHRSPPAVMKLKKGF
jgi:hypothetical protein